MSLSPVHKSGAGDVDGSERGVALRFPRFIRRREDKGATDATSSQQMIAMYRAQVAPPRHAPSLPPLVPHRARYLAKSWGILLGVRLG